MLPDGVYITQFIGACSQMLPDAPRWGLHNARFGEGEAKSKRIYAQSPSSLLEIL